MKVKEIMSKEAVYIPPNTNLFDAAKKMKKYDFGFLPIGENDRLIGTVTDRDIVIGLALDKDPKKTLVKEIMHKKILYCFEDDTLEKAAESMEEQQVHRLVVLNNQKEKRFSGVVSLGDFGRKSKNDELCGELVEKIAQEN